MRFPFAGRVAFLAAVAVLPAGVRAAAEAPRPARAVAEDLLAEDPARLLEVEGGTFEVAGPGSQRVLRWKIEPGQSSRLGLKADHPAMARLPQRDRVSFELRLAGGGIFDVNLVALGHVSGARRYKVHSWQVALASLPVGQWEERSCELTRPDWLPWDNPDGLEAPSFFRFEGVALPAGAVVEIRNLRLHRDVLRLKPDFEPPFTWPIPKVGEDGSASWSFPVSVLNAAGRPVTVVARVASSHQRFSVKVASVAETPAGEAPPPAAATAKAFARHAARVTFAVTATMSAKDAEAAPELYAEPVRLAFSPEDEPAGEVAWTGELVRPLSKGVRRQVLLAEADVARIRKGIAAGDAALTNALGWVATRKLAEEFVEKKLLEIPGGHNWPGSPSGDWKPTDAMPEAANAKTGEKDFNGEAASRAWMNWLNTGGACEALANAWLFTGDERYARKAFEFFRLYARQYAALPWSALYEPPWNAGPPLLSASRNSSSVGYGSNMFFRWHCRLLSAVADAWTDEERRLVYEGFVVPYVTELLKFHGGLSNMSDITNHNLLLLGLAFRDAGLVRQALRRPAGLLNRIADYDADGFGSEARAINYHGVGLDEILPSFGYLALSGLAVDAPKDRLLAAVKMPYLRATLSGNVPSAGDCGRGMRVAGSFNADQLLPVFPSEEWLFDLGRGSTVAAKLRIAELGRKPDPAGWKKLLETAPRLFRQAGFAILRAGQSPETQVMATLDYGANIAHGHPDRMQVTLWAFGRALTHGPGSAYNVGTGTLGHPDPRLKRFTANSNSLGHNVVLVDAKTQLPCIGKLLAWSDRPEFQAAVARVEGVAHGVSHTRGVVLAEGLLLVLDKVEGAAEHTYDFAYHNFGKLALGAGWSSSPEEAPLGKEALYDSLVSVQRLKGEGPVRLRWDLEESFPKNTPVNKNTPKFPAVSLDLWQVPPSGATAYTASTGLNNPDLQLFPDEAPSLLCRARGRSAVFLTVLEPRRGGEPPRVTSAAREGEDGLKVNLQGGKTLSVSLGGLLREHPVAVSR
jgi:hypothetical protein